MTFWKGLRNLGGRTIKNLFARSKKLHKSILLFKCPIVRHNYLQKTVRSDSQQFIKYCHFYRQFLFWAKARFFYNSIHLTLWSMDKHLTAKSVYFLPLDWNIYRWIKIPIINGVFPIYLRAWIGSFVRPKTQPITMTTSNDVV